MRQKQLPMYGVGPIYVAVILALSGLGLGLPAVYWLFLTVLMKHTEERWLLERFGREYEDYCRRVNRCIPWFPREKGGNAHD